MTNQLIYKNFPLIVLIKSVKQKHNNYVSNNAWNTMKSEREKVLRKFAQFIPSEPVNIFQRFHIKKFSFQCQV